MLLSIIKNWTLRFKISLSFFLISQLLFPASIFASSNIDSKSIDMERVSSGLRTFISKLKKKEKLSEIIKGQLSQLTSDQRLYIKDVVQKNGSSSLDLVKFDRYYGEYGVTLKYGNTLLTYDFSKVNEGKIIFNGKELNLEDFYTTAGLKKIENELMHKQVSLIDIQILSNAWAMAEVAFGIVAVLGLFVFLGLILYIPHMIECKGEGNAAFLNEIGVILTCCKAVYENSNFWGTSISETDLVTAKSDCGSAFYKFKSDTFCDNAITAMTSYSGCREGNLEMLEQASKCIKDSQEILGEEYKAVGCNLSSARSLVNKEKAAPSSSGLEQ